MFFTSIKLNAALAGAAGGAAMLLRTKEKISYWLAFSYIVFGTLAATYLTDPLTKLVSRVLDVEYSSLNDGVAFLVGLTGLHIVDRLLTILNAVTTSYSIKAQKMLSELTDEDSDKEDGVKKI